MKVSGLLRALYEAKKKKGVYKSVNGLATAAGVNHRFISKTFAGTQSAERFDKLFAELMPDLTVDELVGWFEVIQTMKRHEANKIKAK